MPPGGNFVSDCAAIVYALARALIDCRYNINIKRDALLRLYWGSASLFAITDSFTIRPLQVAYLLTFAAIASFFVIVQSKLPAPQIGIELARTSLLCFLLPHILGMTVCRLRAAVVP